MKRIGILGGMGPSATIDFYRRLVEVCQKKYICRKNNDFPEMFILNLPVPDLIENMDNKSRTLKMLKRGIKLLEKVESDYIVIPCNTVHIFIKELKNQVDIPILSLVEAVLQEVSKLGYKKVAVLGSMTTLKKKLYQNELRKLGIEYILPTTEDTQLINNFIYGVIGGRPSDEDKKILNKIIQKFEKQGAQGIILGCTELSLMINHFESKISLLDSSQILAEKTLEYYFTQKPPFRSK
jgi:aspartate racemase